MYNRGHTATLYIGENYHVDLPEMRNRTEMIRIMRFKDSGMDYAGVADNLSKTAVESHSDVNQMASITNQL